jgi:serine/threonine-protein kinase
VVGATKFGKYTLMHRIAVGGMAEIFTARQEGMQGFSKKIVIKRIRPHLSSQEGFVKMFLNEARLVAQLTHSNIVHIYDLGKIGKCYFLAMEYVHGRDMRAVLAKSEKVQIPFPMEYSLKVAGAVCEGLYYAHRSADEEGAPLNIVHRDVTPENVMVSFDGEVKILDFGIAKAANVIGETRTGEIKGKLAYMSPEQITGKAVDHRSDLFSLGVMLYEWITGHKLFGAGSDAEVMRNVVDGKIYPPSYFKEGLPAPVEAVLLKALQRNREERYQSAWDLQYDIDQFLLHHEFTPSNIHLSNFMRQLFADEMAREVHQPAQENADQEPREEGTELISEARLQSEHGSKTTQAGGKRKSSGTGAGTGREPITQPADAPAPANVGGNPDLLEAELLAERDGHLSMSVEVERELYVKIHALAERNGMSVPELIRDVLQQFTKYLG